MNGSIALENMRTVSNEEVADIHVCYSPNLTGTTISGDIIPTLIDEIPAIAVLAACAKGKTIIADAAELRRFFKRKTLIFPMKSHDLTKILAYLHFSHLLPIILERRMRF